MDRIHKMILMFHALEVSAAPILRKEGRLEHEGSQSSKPSKVRPTRVWPDSTYWDSSSNSANFANWATATSSDTQTVISDETFMTAFGKDYELDIYWPAAASRASPAPVAIMVHGGGFWTGDKVGDEDLGSQQAAFGSMGYWCVSINYPLKFDMLKRLANPTAANFQQYWSVNDWTQRVRNWGTSSSTSWSQSEIDLYTDNAGTEPQDFRVSQHDAANRAVRSALQYLETTNDDSTKTWYKKMDLTRIICVGGSAGAITCQNTVLSDSSATGLSNYRPTVSLGWSGSKHFLDCTYIRGVSGTRSGQPGAAIFAAHSTDDSKVPIAGDETMIDDLRDCNNNDTFSSTTRVPFIFVKLNDADLHGWFKLGNKLTDGLDAATSLWYTKYDADGSETNGTVSELEDWQNLLSDPTNENKLTATWNFWNKMYTSMFSFAYDNLY